MRCHYGLNMSWQGFTLNEKGQKRVCAAAHSMSTILGKELYRAGTH